MKKYIELLIRMLVVSLLVASCSIKEDRSRCPCLLYLDFSTTDTLKVPEVTVSVTGSDAYHSQADLTASVFMPEYIMEVPRTSIYLNVYSGLGTYTVSERGLVIPVGSQCPKLYSFSQYMDAGGETARAAVDMHKNHCVMSIILNKDDDLEYGLCVKSNVCGYDPEGNPLTGGFSYSPVPQEDGSYSVVLPRQTDSEMRLEIDDGAEVVKSFAIGQYISAGGYDWTTEDLADVQVQIDWARTTITLTVKGWDSVHEYEIVI